MATLYDLKAPAPGTVTLQISEYETLITCKAIVYTMRDLVYKIDHGSMADTPMDIDTCLKQFSG